jgi:hypothetical protein
MIDHQLGQKKKEVVSDEDKFLGIIKQVNKN